MKKIFHESTPLTLDDCLLVFARKNKEFDFPIHFHIDYELNFIIDAAGAQRIVGDHQSIISNMELVMVGPNVVHGWNAEKCNNKEVTEITIQFPRDLFSPVLINKNAFAEIKNILMLTSRGISFSEKTKQEVLPLMYDMCELKGIDSFTKLIEILTILSKSEDYQLLSSKQNRYDDVHNMRINKVYEYIENNFRSKITLEEIASHINMTVISFTRLIKDRTGKTFIEFLNDYRINYAIRILLESDKTISEITDECGFNNQSNFNRIFKQKTGLAPSEYKKNISDKTVVN
jgi:AraC-like DNA-binding protein